MKHLIGIFKSFFIFNNFTIFSDVLDFSRYFIFFQYCFPPEIKKTPHNLNANIAKINNFDFFSIQFDLCMKYVKHMIDIKIMLILQRSIRRNRQYVCKSRTQNKCPVDKTHRNQCRACRLNKCIKAGMNRDGEQSIYHSIYTFTYLH